MHSTTTASPERPGTFLSIADAPERLQRALHIWSRSIAAAALFIAATPAVANAAYSDIRVEQAWSRPAHGTAVAYFTIRNRGAALVHFIGATTPVAGDVQIHESYRLHQHGAHSDMSSMPMDHMPAEDMSVMAMRRLASLTIPAHGKVQLRAGGTHLMLTDLRRDLRAGDHYALTLRFREIAPHQTTVSVHL